MISVETDEASAASAASAASDRRAFRRYALDGACLFFQPASGVHVRVATEATRGLRRCAPRVAMFGITNACNLRCSFCSRDVARASQWTVASAAAAALRGLSRGGERGAAGADCPRRMVRGGLSEEDCPDRIVRGADKASRAGGRYDAAVTRRRTTPARKEAGKPAGKKHLTRSAVPAPTPPEMATLYFHPQRGAVISSDGPNLLALGYRGGSVGEWREVMKLRMHRDERGQLMPVPGQQLPKGFLWGAPERQSYGMGGPELVFGPLSKVCRDCKAPFIFPAHAQKHLLEEVGLYIDVTAVRCVDCARRKAKIEGAKRKHAAALDVLAAYAAAESYLAAARAALELLEAGGRTSIDRAIGHARAARRAGARAAEKVEAKLLEVRAAKVAEPGEGAKSKAGKK